MVIPKQWTANTSLAQYFLPGLLALALLLFGRVTLAATDSESLSIEKPKQIERLYNHVSIHPNGEQWLIDECTERINPPHHSCYLFIYKRSDQSYKRYDLDPAYSYTDARFSPTGKFIVAVRRKTSRDKSYEARLKEYTESELVVLRIDGSDIRVLPTPKGRVKSPVMSPDESKIAYWISGRTRPPGEKTIFMDFDIREFDLASGRDALFTGPYRFFEAHTLHYKTADILIANAYAPLAFVTSMGPYRNKYGSSSIYFFERGEHKFPVPAYSAMPSATSPSAAKDGRIYLRGSPKESGQSLIETADEIEVRRWPVPQWSDQGILSVAVSPDATHVVFTYLTSPVGSSAPQNNLGLFDIALERWHRLNIPLPETALVLKLQN